MKVVPRVDVVILAASTAAPSRATGAPRLSSCSTDIREAVVEDLTSAVLPRLELPDGKLPQSCQLVLLSGLNPTSYTDGLGSLRLGNKPDRADGIQRRKCFVTFGGATPVPRLKWLPLLFAVVSGNLRMVASWSKVIF